MLVWVLGTRIHGTAFAAVIRVPALWKRAVRCTRHIREPFCDCHDSADIGVGEASWTKPWSFLTSGLAV